MTAFLPYNHNQPNPFSSKLPHQSSLQTPSHAYSHFAPRVTTNPNIPSDYPNRLNASNINYIPPNNLRAYSPISPPSHFPSRGVRQVSPNIIRERLSPDFANQPINKIPYQTRQHQNIYRSPTQNIPFQTSNFTSQNPLLHSTNSQAPFSYQPYQQPYQQGFPPNAYSSPYSQNNFPQYSQNLPSNYVPSYVPLYSQPLSGGYQNVSNQFYNQYQRNVPQTSINSNFNYEHANFDVNYSIQQNLVHCVICNKTYKTSQKKQHLQFHRQKARNIDIRPVDEQQLKRLQKYNSMNRKGLVVKPIVQPDEFNVQYTPNQFILKKVTLYNDVDGPSQHNIQVQTSDVFANERSLHDTSRVQINPNVSFLNPNSPQIHYTNSYNYEEDLANKRNTNTRFNSESIKEQQKIFISDKFNSSKQGEQFNSHYNPNESYRESQRKSNQGSPEKSVRESSYEKNMSLGYKQDNLKASIPIRQVVNNVNRQSYQ